MDIRIPVVVVESHQHVLEHVHSVLRRRARMRYRRLVARRRERQPDDDGGGGPPPKPPPPTPPLTMVHLDSHPDLACPSADVPAGSCFEPRREWPSSDGGGRRGCASNRGSGVDTAAGADAAGGDEAQATTAATATRNLYEFLDLDRSGIAQWILPLVVSGDVGTVRWVRSSWADHAFRDGTYEFNVGAWAGPSPPPPPNSPPPPPPTTTVDSDGITSFVDLPPASTVKVDLRHPYYYDDDSVVPTEELLLRRRLRLFVSELPAAADDDDVQGETSLGCRSSSGESGEDDDDDWILDICLDYFACRNPFLAEIEDVDAAFARALRDAVTMPSFRRRVLEVRSATGSSSSSSVEGDCVPPDGDCGSGSASAYRRDSRAFHRIMARLLGAHCALEKTNESETEDTSQVGIASDNTCGKLSEEEDYEELFSLYSSPQAGRDVIGKLEGALAKITSTATRKRLAALAIDALPDVTLPQGGSALDRRAASSEDDALALALERVEAVGAALRADRFGFGRPPVAVTVARSSDDGFTPMTMVNELQRAVLGVVHAVYCGCQGGPDGMVDDEAKRFGPDSLVDGCRLCLLCDYGEWEGSSFEL